MTYLLTIEQLLRYSQACSSSHEAIRRPYFPIRNLSKAAAKTRQMFPRWNIRTRILALCEVSKPSIIIIFILGVDLGQLLKVEFVPQHGANATEAFDELIALARTIGDEFEGCAVIFVALGEPFEE